MSVLVKHSGHIVGKDDIVFGLALTKFVGDFVVGLIVLVFRFPIAERYAQPVQQRAVGVDAVAFWCNDGVFGNKLRIERLAPAFQQIPERFAHDTFAAAARYLAKPVQFSAILIDQLAAQVNPLLSVAPLTHEPIKRRTKLPEISRLKCRICFERFGSAAGAATAWGLLFALVDPA